MKKIRIGIAGTRGLSTIQGLRSIPDVEITAMCDLDEGHLKDASERIGGDVKTFRVFDDMLETDIDAVVIATPMQCHVPQAIAAMEAGKHVMSEVTAGVTMDELWWLCETTEKYHRIYMYAENYIYAPKVQLVRKLVEAGYFGETYYAEGAYLHDIRDLAVYPDGKTSWRSYWQLGKRGNFYPTHSIGPVMQWFPGDRITEISTFSPGIRNSVGLRQDSGTTTMCRTEKGNLLSIRTDCVSPRPHNMDNYLLQGTKGIFQSAQYGKGNLAGDLDRVSFTDSEEKCGGMDWEDLMKYSDLLPDRYKNATPEQRKAGHDGGDFFIVKDFIDALKEERQPELDVYKACEWTAVGLLSELSVTNGGRTMEVPDFRKDTPVGEMFTKL
ncbi:MAG: Gfo/Idh/MocA family oxidoreductase [Clostridiales bacterium]|nr:Gfo/Idh/MocA family oxidoreductase [Clostridiales bacterium]